MCELSFTLSAHVINKNFCLIFASTKNESYVMNSFVRRKDITHIVQSTHSFRVCALLFSMTLRYSINKIYTFKSVKVVFQFLQSDVCVTENNFTFVLFRQMCVRLLAYRLRISKRHNDIATVNTNTLMLCR